MPYNSSAQTSYSQLAQQRADLFQTYQKLDQKAQQVMQVLAMTYEPVGRVAVITICNALSKLDESYSAFTDSSFTIVWRSLLDKGLLNNERNQFYWCNPLIVELITRETIEQQKFDLLMQAIDKQMPVTAIRGDQLLFRNLNQCIRRVRWAIYQHDLVKAESYIVMNSAYGYMRSTLSLDAILQVVCNNPFDEHWLDTCPHDMAERILLLGLRNGAWQLVPVQPIMSYAEDVLADETWNCSDQLLLVSTEQLLLCNQLAKAEQTLSRISEAYRDVTASYWGWLNVLKGNIAEAIVYYEHALKAVRKQQKKRKTFFDGFEGVFYILALLKQGSPANLKLAEEYSNWMARQNFHPFSEMYQRFEWLLKVQQGDLSQKRQLIRPLAGHPPGVDLLIMAFCLYWGDPQTSVPHLLQPLEEIYQSAELGEYHWVMMEAAELLAKVKSNDRYKKVAQELRESSGISSIIHTLQATEAWELCLTALTNLSKADSAITGGTAEMRLAWFISLRGNHCYITPKEQKINAKGIWSKGRAIALKRLKNDPEDFNYLSPQDLRACQQIKSEYNYSYYGSDSSYSVDTKALLALVGHPYVFWEDVPEVRIDIVKADPELLVKKDSKRKLLQIQLSPAITDPNQSIAYAKETLTRLRVTEIQDSHHRIAQILGVKNQLEVPLAAQERVLAAISSISGLVTVHSDIGGGMENVEEVPADAKPHVHLLPAGGGLKVAILVRPFAVGGSYFQPGQGGETVIAEIDGKRLQTTRILKEEKRLAKATIDACAILAEWIPEDGEWIIDEPEACLELLMELHSLEDQVTIEWPEGEKFRVKNQADSSSFSMNIKRQKDWFEASGELQIGTDDVLNMQQLMQLLDKSTGRFVPLGNGEFLALTDEFRKRLQELRSYSEKHGEGVRFHPLAALALEDVVDQIGQVKTDKAWKEQAKKLKAARNHQPKLPSTLQADLRDYQVDGFEWMSRLAHWGVGACLADDMGLGKTLQALAMILSHAAQGPSLVIAPLSVSLNWISETAKFAPTLNVVQFGGGDRQKTLDDLKPRDLFICSYGLLQQEDVSEMLAKVQWQTIVLDEAQAIKNMQTKRSQAAMKLQAEFKLITTGTPIENHLGELWNLFRFINPGLLGSLENFNQKYAGPIEREQDKEARQRLKKLIQPFILRRTKNQVLSELPSRTEILLQVELSQEEKAFYEALRREAIAKLADSSADAGAKHLQVLAEIMKLRRACCNPDLVKPKMKIKSSKLELFGETLTELLENKHKALVFSQFVDHLTIIREYLDQQKINYQYLDGSTPAKERKKRVDAFQAGEGDVFLISLKAGGTGLNLTAADYVIHMDPWWNPAVEDQASDRAHRIGQQRPVTIYRLVAQGTIEEKIVELHHQKRDLASSLLEGSEISGKVSTDELLRLIQES